MLTNLDFLNIGQPWPPPSEIERLQDYEQSRLLFEAEHPKVFNDWYRVLRNDQQASLEFVINLPKRLSTLWADLLFGEAPRFLAGEDESAEQQACDRIVSDNMLPVVGHETVIDVSRYGDGLLKVRLENGRAVIEGQPPAMWFPVLSPANVRQVTHHVLAWTFDVGTGSAKQSYLRVEIHTPGRIEYRMLRITGGVIREPVDGTTFDPAWKESEATNVNDFLLVPVHGLRTTDRYHGLDDYADIISILQEIEVRLAQISRVLDKHADPSMYGPSENIQVNPQTGETEFRVEGGRWFISDDSSGAPVGYVTWEGQLEAAFKQLDELRQWFYMTSDTSPAAFGHLEQGLAESGSALKRLLLAPLAHVNRIKLRLHPAFVKVVRLAAELEAANGTGTPTLDTVEIEWRDGIPDDPKESAEVEQIRLTSGNTSRKSSIRRLDGGTEASIEAELDLIAEDEASSAARMPAALAPGNLSQSFGDDEEN